MRKHRLAITLLSAGALALACHAMARQQASPDDGTRTGAGVSAQDESFLRNASADGASEVSLGQLALQQSATPEVHRMAQRIVDDHTRTNRQLAQLAVQEHVMVPAQPKPAAVEESRKLRALHGEAFDRAYAQAMVQDHHKAIALFTEASQSGNARIRQLAQATLPALNTHLDMAQAIVRMHHAVQSAGQTTAPSPSAHGAASSQGD